MAKLSHYLEYGISWLGIGMARALPASAADRLACLLGRLAYRLLKSRRRIATENLRRAMGETLPADQVELVVRQAFEHAAQSVIEMTRIASCARKRSDDIFIWEGLEKMRRVYAEGRGGIIVTAHFGGFELLTVPLCASGIPMNFMTGVQHNQKVNALANRLRQGVSAGFFPVDKGVRDVFRVLKKGEFLGLISDQHAPSGVVVEFFGRPAATPRGPATFAVRSGAPVLPVMMRRERYDRYVVTVGDPIYPPGSGDQDADVLTITAAYTRYFETVVRQYPGQWLWTHRRWKVD